jgi:hypothetical protein
MKTTIGRPQMPIEAEIDIIDAKKLVKRPLMVDKMVPNTHNTEKTKDLTKLSEPERTSHETMWMHTQWGDYKTS